MALTTSLACAPLFAAGEVRRSHYLRIGRYNQHFEDILPMDKTPVDHLREMDPEGKMTEQRGTCVCGCVR